MKTIATWSVLFVVAIFAVQVLQKPSLYTIVAVDDGDTIRVMMAGKEEIVRLIGVDTPETKDPRKPVQCFGPEASTFTHTLEGKRIHLVADPLSTNRDRYDRLLRYVYLEDGTFYNQHLIETGYARAYVGFPFSHMSDFTAAQTTAKQQNNGLWGACPTEVSATFGTTVL